MESVLVHFPLAQHFLGTGCRNHRMRWRTSLLRSSSSFNSSLCFMCKPSLTKVSKPFSLGVQTSVLPELGSQKQSRKQRRLSRLYVASKLITSETHTAAPSPVEYGSWQNGRHGVVFSTKEMLEATGGRLPRDGRAGSICTDSRKVQEGDWFLALKGDKFDAHDFLSEVSQKGCAGAIGVAMPPDWSHGFLQVEDTLEALQQLASHVRSRFKGPVVGITGSSGKTGTRAMVGLALRPLGHVHETSGNLNNHIGVPLTLLATPSQSKALVLELGMNHAGEIAELAAICQPTVRLITNIGPVHLEGLGSVEAIAAAKGELFDAARSGDTIVLNMDDPLVVALPIPDRVHVLRYGASCGADVRIINVRSTNGGLGVKCVVQRKEGERTAESSLLKIDHPGTHLVRNALAAVAVAVALGVPLKAAVRHIQEYEPVGMRMRLQRCYRSGITLLNDAYNANPMSVRAALDLLARADCGGKKVAFLGDMLELGTYSHQAHRDALQQCVDSKIDAVGVCGKAFQQAALEFGPEHFKFEVFADSSLLAESVSLSRTSGAASLGVGDLVLVKGSRGLCMERVCETIEALEDQN